MCNIPFSISVEYKKKKYRITKTAITTPMRKSTETPTAPPTDAELTFAEDIGVA